MTTIDMAAAKEDASLVGGYYSYATLIISIRVFSYRSTELP
jgi:hypothetical protein